MYFTNSKFQKNREIRKVPYSITRETNGEKFVNKSCRNNCIVEFSYSDGSSIIFDLIDGIIFIIDYYNTVVYVEKPKREFDINLLTEAANFLKNYYAKH